MSDESRILCLFWVLPHGCSHSLYSFLSDCSVVLFPGCLFEEIRKGFGQLKILFLRMSIAPASKKLRITLLTADALCLWKHLLVMVCSCLFSASNSGNLNSDYLHNSEWLHPEWRCCKPTPMPEWWWRKPVQEWGAMKSHARNSFSVPPKHSARSRCITTTRSTHLPQILTHVSTLESSLISMYCLCLSSTSC